MAEEKSTRNHPVLKGILFTFIGLWAVILVAMQVVLNSNVLTKIVNNIAAEYVDGDIAFGEIKASVIKSFPDLNVSLTDFSITYPHDRFAAFDSTGVRSFHRRAGRGAEADTLASVNNVSISLNYVALAFGKIRIPEIKIQKPRFYLHQYDSTSANWNMFVTG
ncbi:MAG: AsmA family protein, partial [Bacteroidales bacterium]|nr:AsmA family protein [Bacteroidales bacterium]